MKTATVFSLLTALLLLAGCTSTGTKIQPGKITSIERGVTTEQQVIAIFGKPDSITTTPDRRVLTYSHQQNNSAGRSALTSTGAILGGMAGGALGSMAGSLAANTAMPREIRQEVFTVEVDAGTGKVLNYKFQQSQ